MGKNEKLRWTVLATALAGTIGAIFYPVDEPDGMPAMPLSRSGTVIPKASGLAEAPDQARPVWIASNEDPFAPRVWDAAPPAVETARDVQKVELNQVVPEAPPPPPPLPYRFLGQMQDGADRVFYLGHGDQIVLARQGETLEGSYKVVAVNPDMIEFESVQSGVRQTLPIPAQ